MLFLLFGSSAAGKTFALNELRGRVEGLAIHDFDEIGVPPGADTAWRQANEQWVRRALDYQAEGTDLLLAGQTPVGELLAAPSARHLEAFPACPDRLLPVEEVATTLVEWINEARALFRSGAHPLVGGEAASEQPV